MPLKYRDSYLFELVAALERQRRYGITVWIWREVPNSVLNRIGFPSEDVGADYISEDTLLLGQAKCYRATKRVPAQDIRSTRYSHCRWWSSH